MSSQSAQLRTASQATVNAYAPRVELPKVSDERAGAGKGMTLVSLVPVGILGWFAVPALADWLGNILA